MARVPAPCVSISAPNARERTVPIVQSSMFVKGATKLTAFNAEMTWNVLGRIAT